MICYNACICKVFYQCMNSLVNRKIKRMDEWFATTLVFVRFFTSIWTLSWTERWKDWSNDLYNASIFKVFHKCIKFLVYRNIKRVDEWFIITLALLRYFKIILILCELEYEKTEWMIQWHKLWSFVALMKFVIFCQE